MSISRHVVAERLAGRLIAETRAPRVRLRNGVDLGLRREAHDGQRVGRELLDERTRYEQRSLLQPRVRIDVADVERGAEVRLRSVARRAL